jgi:hypothetical protein
MNEKRRKSNDKYIFDLEEREREVLRKHDFAEFSTTFFHYIDKSVKRFISLSANGELTNFSPILEQLASSMNVTTDYLKEKCTAPFRLYTGYVNSSKILRDKNVTLHTHYIPYVACSDANKFVTLNKTEVINMQESIPKFEEKIEIIPPNPTVSVSDIKEKKIEKIYSSVKHEEL